MSATAKKTETTLDVGSPAPAFSLPDETGTTRSLNDFKGQKVVLYFYPKDDTPGCTMEAKDFAAKHAEFVQAGAVILGVSKDNQSKHDKFKCKYNLPFSLLSDTEGEACAAYGVWAQKSMFGKKYMGIQRATFLIDADGTIAKIWPKVKVTGHASDVLKAVKAL